MKDQDAQSMARMPVDGGALTVLRRGQGPLTIWLHGWALDHRMWRPQLALAAHWTMMLPDRRGFGHSSAPGQLDREWQDVEALAPAGRVALIGLSQGAAVALDYARRHPERVAALVLIGVPLHGVEGIEAEPDAVQREDLAEIVRAGRVPEIRAMLRSHPSMQVATAARPLRDRMIEGYEGRDLCSGAHWPGFSLTDLAALPMPVLAMVGEDDSVWRRRCAERIAMQVPQGELAIVPDARRLCTLDDPGRVNALIEQFLQTHHASATCHMRNGSGPDTQAG